MKNKKLDYIEGDREQSKGLTVEEMMKLNIFETIAKDGRGDIRLTHYFEDKMSFKNPFTFFNFYFNPRQPTHCKISITREDEYGDEPEDQVAISVEALEGLILSLTKFVGVTRVMSDMLKKEEDDTKADS